MFTIFKNKIFLSLLGVIAIASFTFYLNSDKEVYAGAEIVEEDLGGVSDGRWYMVDNFDGYQTKFDETKIAKGATGKGQNTTVNDKDRISIRKLGYGLFPTTETLDTTTANRILSTHTFRKRNGENILMRSSSSSLQYFEEGNQLWENIKRGYTEGFEFGFADYNINTDLTSYVYFGNSQEPFSRWNGGHSILNGALTSGDGTITVDSTSGFASSGSLFICNTTVTYSGKSSTTFTGASGTPTCADDRSTTQAVTTFATNPKGNIYINKDNRLFIAGVTSTPQAIFFSAYGDAEDFIGATLVADGTDASPGIFNLGEGGGGVVGMAQDEESLYAFKRSMIYKITLSDTLYTLTPLKTFDGKSQTTGAVNNNSIFAGGNGIFFITPDNQIMNLARVETIDYPQIIPISDIIKPTVDAVDFASSTGIVFRDKAFFAVKSTVDSVINDTVLVWNIHTQDWDTPILGWNVSDWSVYAEPQAIEELYFGDGSGGNIFKVNTQAEDYIFSVKASHRTKQENLGLPYNLKEIDSVYLEGYIAQNTTLTVSLLLDEDGFTQIYTTEISGTDDDLIFDAGEFNLFGLSAFGTDRFGTQGDISGLRKFRVYLNKDLRRIPFYNWQLEFASDDDNQNWEITHYGVHWRQLPQGEDRNLYKSFN